MAAAAVAAVAAVDGSKASKARPTRLVRVNLDSWGRPSCCNAREPCQQPLLSRGLNGLNGLSLLCRRRRPRREMVLGLTDGQSLTAFIADHDL